MKKRKAPSRLTKLLYSPAVEEVVDRMVYSEVVSEILRQRAPVLFWCLLPPLLLILLLPMMVCISFVGDTTGTIWLLPVYFAWCCTSIPAGLGAVNLCMPLLQKLCEWLLREDFPDGLEKPLYLGHGFTALFLLGFGGAAALLSWILTFF